MYELAATNNEVSPGIREIFFMPIKHACRGVPTV